MVKFAVISVISFVVPLRGKNTRRMRSLKIISPRLLFVLATVMTVLWGCSKDDIATDAKEELIRSMVADVNADSVRSHILKLQGLGTRFTLAQNHRKVAVSIRQWFRNMGYPDARLDSFRLDITYKGVAYSLWQYNVIAEIKGSLYPDSVCILGAHFDDIISNGDPFTIAPGAHDNASGTAATMEVARVMKKIEYAPEKSIMFVAFGAEELGLYGSKDFARDPEGYQGKIAFMVNNDMIAYEPTLAGAGWEVNILDYQNSQDLRRYAQQMMGQFTSLGYRNDNTYNRYSDSYSFYTRGYKAIFFSSIRTDPYYHTVADVVGNLNIGYCTEITRASLAVLAGRN